MGKLSYVIKRQKDGLLRDAETADMLHKRRARAASG